MTVIPAIDLKNGKCVRLRKGDFSTAHTVAEDPVNTAREFLSSGASLIHMVDLDGAETGENENLKIVERVIRETNAKIELGGGIRSIEKLNYIFGLGVERAVIGSAAIESKPLVKEAVSLWGSKIAVGIDALDGLVRTRGWLENSGINYLDFASEMESLGVQTIIFTDISSDGMESGPCYERLERLRAHVNCSIVASGGICSLSDIANLKKSGINAAIVGKAIYSGALNLSEAIKLSKQEAL